MEGRWRSLSCCFGWVSLPGHKRQVVIKEQPRHWLVAFSIPIPARRVPELHSTSGLLSPTPPALSAVATSWYQYQLVLGLNPFLLEILGAFPTINPSWCTRILLQWSRVEREVRQETREELGMSCHDSFTHARVHSMIPPCRHLLSLNYVLALCQQLWPFKEPGWWWS